MTATGSPTRLRLSMLGLVLVSLFSVLLARLWYLQVLASPDYRVQAEGNRVRLVPEPAPRGRILDRLGRVLVDNRVANVVTVNRSELAGPRRDRVLTRLAPVVGVAKAELERRLLDPRPSPYKPVPVAEDVPEGVVLHIREHQDEFPGVEATQVAERLYPHGALAAHLLGYVGEINGDELAERRGDGYRLGDSIGKSGIERVYESVLRGEAGLEKLEVDARGKVIRTLGSRLPVQGDDVVTTIDLEVQRLAEESLAMGLEASRRHRERRGGASFAAPAGSVVVLDPRDGSVLALASHPTYDPSLFVGGIRPDLFRALQDPAGHYPLNNRALQGQYAPGSTFKLVTAIAGLNGGLIEPDTTIVDGGSYTLASCRGTKCRFRNAGGRAYGQVNLARALTVSSDVYFYGLGATFWTRGPETGIQDIARRLGFGERTGIPLPFEAPGRVSDEETRKRLHELAPDKFPNGRWFTGDNVNLAIGQGELAVTPLQLANAYAAFANGGTVYQPRVAVRFTGRDGKTVQEVKPVPQRHLEVGPAGRAAIMAGLTGAVVSPEGTATGAFGGFPFDRMQVAGKTGTAQVHGRQDTALFVGIAPVAAPEYVVAVVLEEAGFGGQAAAPVARRVLQGIAGETPGGIGPGGGRD